MLVPLLIILVLLLVNAFFVVAEFAIVGVPRSAIDARAAGNDRLARLAHRLPHGDSPQTEKLTEDLAHLRSGDEIAVAPDRLARGVIAGARVGEAGLHVGSNAQGAFAGNQLLEPRRKRRLLGAGEFQVRTHHEARAATRQSPAPRADACETRA